MILNSRCLALPDPRSARCFLLLKGDLPPHCFQVLLKADCVIAEVVSLIGQGAQMIAVANYLHMKVIYSVFALHRQILGFSSVVLIQLTSTNKH